MRRPVEAGTGSESRAGGSGMPVSQPPPFVDESQAEWGDEEGQRGGEQASSVRAGAVRRRWLPAVGFGVAALLVILIAGWFAAYRMGQQQGRETVLPYLSEKNGTGNGTAPVLPDGGKSGLEVAGGNGGTPSGVNPTPSGGTDGKGGSGAAPEAVKGPKVGEDPRQNGYNYLELCTITFREGIQAVDFLGRNGVKAGLVPAVKKVDPARAAANNDPHILFVADGIASDRFKTSERERAQLVAKVEQIGKKFQRDQRGASDFSRPMWRLFKDKDRQAAGAGD